MLDGDPTGPHVSEGVLLTRAYLKRINSSIPKFCEDHGLDRLQVQRILNGEQRRISVEFADAMERATEGRVGWRTWAAMVPSNRVKSFKVGSLGKGRPTGTDG